MEFSAVYGRFYLKRPYMAGRDIPCGSLFVLKCNEV